MKKILIALVVALAVTPALAAEQDAACMVAEHLVNADFPLSRVAAAIQAKQFNITVIGSASSALHDAAGANKGYPERLQSVLQQQLPEVAVKVTAHAKARESATTMEKQFGQLLAADKPSLVVWQTGTVEAMRRADIDDFRSVLDEGIDQLRAGSSDVILMNMQYSPRTDLMIDAVPYADTMRFTAMQHEVLLFDRLAVMRHWGELGTFDFTEATKKIDTAARVHDCIARLLAHQILQGANLPNTVGHAIR